MKKSADDGKKSERIGIIKTVETPLGFFVLVVLIVEAVFGIVAGFSKESLQSIIIVSMICLIFSLIAIVAFLAYARPEALKGLRALPYQDQSGNNKIIEPLTSNTKTYETKDASEFYGRIAHKYDESNTNYLLQTHRSVTDALRSVVDQIPNAKILDLSGGTGRLIADHFHDKKGLSWSYVDNCPNMVTLFEENLKGTALQREVLNENIYNIHNKLRGKQYDAIIMSCLLTSLPNLPEFANFLPLLAPHGVIIIADIDPSYTALHPC
jgi:2-polyprenyl-3-methyl-5-hydroxy-6-metoxy-1,4-benzoquinol methylase